MIEKNNVVYVLGSSFKVRTSIKEAFPNVKFELVPSEENLYQEAFKIQPKMNLTHFKSGNKAATKAVLFIRGAPQESFTPEAGVDFAKKILSALKG